MSFRGSQRHRLSRRLYLVFEILDEVGDEVAEFLDPFAGLPFFQGVENPRAGWVEELEQAPTRPCGSAGMGRPGPQAPRVPLARGLIPLLRREAAAIRRTRELASPRRFRMTSLTRLAGASFSRGGRVQSDPSPSASAVRSIRRGMATPGKESSRPRACAALARTLSLGIVEAASTRSGTASSGIAAARIHPAEATIRMSPHASRKTGGERLAGLGRLDQGNRTHRPPRTPDFAGAGGLEQRFPGGSGGRTESAERLRGLGLDRGAVILEQSSTQRVEDRGRAPTSLASTVIASILTLSLASSRA